MSIYINYGFSGLLGFGANKVGAVGGLGIKKYFKEKTLNTSYLIVALDISHGKGDEYYKILNNDSELFAGISVIPGYCFRISQDNKFVGNIGLGASIHSKGEILEKMYNIKEGRGTIWITADISASYRF